MENLKTIVKEIEQAMDRYDLSDDYLQAHGCAFPIIGEFQYGVSSVPCAWVYPYLHALISDERLAYIVKEIEDEIMEDK